MDGTICHRISQDEWSPRVPGHMQILGKVFMLERQILCDSDSRIAEAKALLISLLHQAHSDPHRMVFMAAIRRSLGIWIFVTAQAPSMRCHLRGLIKALCKAGAFGNDRFIRKNLSAAWRMGKSAYTGASSLHSADQKSIDQWLADWQELPLGSKTMLPNSCDAELEALMTGIALNNQRAFMPRRSPPEQHEEIVYIHSDSAGLSEEEPDSFRGAGAWFHSPGWTEVQWMQEQYACPQYAPLNSRTLACFHSSFNTPNPHSHTLLCSRVGGAQKFWQ